MKLPVEHLLNGRMKAPVMRSLNGIQLLNLIRQHGPVSRAALAKLSHLSKPTVSLQVLDLLRRGLAVELGLGDSGRQGGKKPTMVAFNADGGRLAALEVGAEQARIAVADLAGRILSESDLALYKRDPRRSLRAMHTRMQELLTPSGISKLRAIGVAMPGRVDPDRGKVYEADNLPGWEEIDIAAALGEGGIAVRLDNDVNLAAAGEWSHALKRSVKSMVLIRAETGVGAGVIVNGALHRGANWAAGEAGHMVIGSLEPRRTPGRGQLELAIGMDRVAQRVRAAAKQSPKLANLLQEYDELPALLEAARARDAAAAELLDELTAHLGIAVANVAALYDPSVIVLSGPLLEALHKPVEQIVHKVIPWPANIRVSGLGREAAILGAIDLAMETAYEEIAVSIQSEPQAAAAGVDG